MRTIQAGKETLEIGKQGENLALAVKFNIQSLIDTYGNGTAQLIAQRPGDYYPYAVTVLTDDNCVCWVVTSTDTAVPGKGRCELRYYVGDTLVKSRTWSTHVVASLGGAGLTPAPMQAWLDDVLKAAAAIKEATADNSEQLAKKADNICFDSQDNSIQLTANGQPIGDKIVIPISEGKSILNVDMTTDGELLIFFSDGSIQNLGKVTGKDGKVYVPHIDAHKVLSFTIEDAAGEIPEPVDFDPSDDWQEIGGGVDDSIDSPTGLVTPYLWEGI